MMIPEQPSASARVYNVLCLLGAKPETTGFYFSAYAIELVCAQPQRSTFVTKWLYPDVAQAYKATVSSVERGIRLTANTVWDAQTELGRALFPGEKHPTASHFISRVSMYLMSVDIPS